MCQRVEGGRKFGICRSPRIWPLSAQIHYRSSSIWGSKVQVFEGQRSGRAPPPSSVQYVLTSPHPSSQVKGRSCKSLHIRCPWVKQRSGLDSGALQQQERFWRSTLANPPKSSEKLGPLLGNENWTQTFFSQTFRAPPGYPGKIPGYPAQKVWFPWFRGTYRTFWPPPVHVEDPYPTGKYPDQKVWVWVPFSSLTYRIGKCPHKQNRERINQKYPKSHLFSIFDVLLPYFQGCCVVVPILQGAKAFPTQKKTDHTVCNEMISNPIPKFRNF